PQPIPAHKIAEITPAVPDTAEPFSGNMSKQPNGTASAPAPAAHAETAKAARKRPDPKQGASDESALGLDLEEPGGRGSLGERMLTSDGATRLLVTAYIGIGNRLFI